MATGGREDAEAAELVKKAEKTARGGFLSFFSGGPNYEEACQHYVVAANKYKMGRLWQSAADCFVRAAFLQQKMGDRNQEAKFYTDAADLIKKYSTNDCIEYYSKAVDIYNLQGRFSQSGKIMRGLAEMHEEEGNSKDVGRLYKQAADYFEMDEYSKSPFSQCILKYAEHVARYDGNYEEAIQIFEKEGEKALRSNLIQFGAKEHFLKAGILLLAAGDAIDAKVKTEKYEEMDPRLASSREGKLLRSLVEAFEKQDAEMFVQSIHDYDSVTRLDPWKIHFLYKVKEALSPSGMTADGMVDMT